MAAYKLGIIPNVMGLANTAFLKVNRNIYTVFERDYPYKININVENKRISTDKKMHITGVNTLSGHSKYKDDTIHSIDYNILSHSLYYYQFDPYFNKKMHVLIKTKYIPLIHDFFLFSSEEIMVVDSPLQFNLLRTFPVIFNRGLPTYIHIYNNTIHQTDTYTCSHAFYLFHYADVIETSESIDIYAPIYDTIDFTSLNIQGKYRKLVLDKKTKEITIHKNPELENMNVDFPKKWGDYIILRYIENNAIAGFIICKELEIIKQIPLPDNRYFCGEPAIIDIEGDTFLIGFCYNNDMHGYFSIVGVSTDAYIEVALYTNVTMGFHSIFL
jgi:carotenoid cleavage dioxygenase-like enzyme